MRISEPNSLMEDLDQCTAYNKYAADTVQLHEYIRLYEKLIGIKQGTVVDLGSGSCNFIIALANNFPDLRFVCYEASDAMIEIANKNIKNSNLSDRIQIVKADILNATGKYDAVLANRLLHHIEKTEQFWKLVNSLSEKVLVIDIDRPPPSVIEHIRNVDEYDDPIYKEDLLNSMQAAYSLEEVTEQIKQYNYTVITDNYYKLIVYHTR
jgi:cyclopropane fatty-acyl-phospholipid synthase-like methyltransferase